MSDSEEPPAEEPPQQESGEDTLPVSQPSVDDVPTVVVGKKRASRAKPVPAEPLEEPVEEPLPEVKVKPSRSRKQVSSLTQAKAKARAPPAQVTEEPAPPPPSPKKARQRKTPSPTEQATEPPALEAAPTREQWHPTRLLNDMNDFTVRIQELHRLNELHRKSMYKKLIGGMV